MNTLNSLWSDSVIMVQNSDYSVLVTSKLDNGWYRGDLITSCSLGYSIATSILLPGTDAIWTLING